MECAGVMSINWEPDSRLAQLVEQIRLSQEPTLNLLSRVIAETSLLLPAPADLASGRRIENLVHAQRVGRRSSGSYRRGVASMEVPPSPI
jgi:hypothetical protein